MSIDTTNARNALATQSNDPRVAAKADIAKMASQFTLVLPSHIPADRIVRVLQTVVQQNPDLADPRGRQALLGAAMTCAQLGLDPTPAIGHAYIYPFKKNGVPVPTFVLGYKGAVFLAADNGVHLKSWAIHENDTYDVQLGTEGHIKHKLPPFGQPRGRAIAYYCVASFSDGTPPMFDVMALDEVERIRQGSPGKNSPAWNNHYDEMAKKTVLKRLAKNVPVGTKLAEASAHDGQQRLDSAPEALDVPEYGDDVADAEIMDDVHPDTGEIIPPKDQR